MSDPIARHTLVPDLLTAAVYAHEVDTRDGLLPCWSYVTDGFARLGHPELVFTLRRTLTDARDAFPSEPFDLFRGAHAALNDGHAIRPGEVAAFPGGGLFGREELRAITWRIAEPLAGVAIVPGSLCAVLLVGREADVAAAFGPLRVTARLGQDAGHFPSPPWSDRQRQDVCVRDAIESSALWTTLRLTLDGASVVLTLDTITLTLPDAAAGELATVLAANEDAQAVTLRTALDPNADGCLVWWPGQTEAAAIAPSDGDGERIGGGFVVIARGSDESGANVFEDGFALRVTDAQWSELRIALSSGLPFVLTPSGEGLRFALRWARTTSN